MNATHRAARKAIAVVAAASAIATLTELSAATAGSPQADSLSPAPRAATAGAVAADGSALRPFSWLIRPTGTREQFRGLAAVGRRVAWVSGEKGSVLITTNGGDSWRNVSPPRADGLALRDIEARDSLHAVTLSIGSGRDSRIYSTSDGGKTWSERFRNSNPDAFYDCLAISRSGRGMALSDPVNGRFRLVKTRDYGQTWRVLHPVRMPRARKGEFAFAASGTCLVAKPHNNFWFVTGGVDTPRIFRTHNGGHTWNVRPTPLRGGPSAGIYSVDFRTIDRGVMVGGDYTEETNGKQASAFLAVGERAWRLSGQPVRGYRSGVAYIPRTSHTVVAVGPSGTDVSRDGGRTWSQFSHIAFDGIQCSKRGGCWASGPDGRVAKLLRAGS